MEALVSIALIGVCIGVMAALFSGAAQSMRQQSDSDEKTVELTAALQAVGLEVQQAVQGTVQSTGQSGSTLTMVRVAGAATPSPTALATVQIQWNSATRELVRSCGDVSMTVARGVTAFSTDANAPGGVEVSVQVTGTDGSTLQSSEVVQPMLVALPSPLATVQP